MVASRFSTRREVLSNVIPAKAGIQGRRDSIRQTFQHWTPAFAGVTYNRRRGRRQTRLSRRHGSRAGKCTRSGGTIAVGWAVGKPARRRSTRPTRWARAATKRGRERLAMPWWNGGLFVAAASSPAEGPSVSRHAAVPPDRRARRAPLRGRVSERHHSS